MSGLGRIFRAVGLSAASVAILGAATGCDTQAFCFDQCDDGSGTTSTGQGGAGGAGNSVTVTGQGGNQPITVTATTGTSGCTPTNPTEICDGIDNDCNGEIDEGIDFSDPRQCGNCDTNCFAVVDSNWLPDTVTCTPPQNPGEAGTCAGECAPPDNFDFDGDGLCDDYCVPAEVDDTLCNEKDDDCDGDVDEDVDLCTDPDNCGICGRQCNAANATPQCVSEADPGVECSDVNTICVIGPNDCAPGFHDANGLYSDGCEYPCVETNGGVEICGDQIDNDCDGRVDGADDDLSGDPFVGQDCFGGQQPGQPAPEGVCGAVGNEGQYACGPNGYVCEGPNVVLPGDLVESCNGEDDDCNGLDDDNPSDAGSACGISNNAPCRFGQNQCVNGALTCIGAINPGIEVCNGRDDDCDGGTDLANGQPPADSMGTCNVPPAVAPPGVSACQAGTLACVGGVIDCQGDVTAPANIADTCGVDQNCDGALTNQPNTATDVRNCGSCGNDCYAGAVNSIWSCQNSACVFEGCANGFSDPNNDQLCEYACVPTGPEVCNNVDDDCDGATDENVVAPPPTQICGVSPSATRPECTTNVSVTCTGGVFTCNFPAGVCAGGCSANDEICDNLDNDCDGLVNENVANFGQSCASDAGQPPPGDGACRTFGTFVCNGPNAVTCNAQTADCANLPGGCTELCDGVDNDCDGDVDETYDDPGSDPTFFYRPKTVRITSGGSSRWIAAYEASRPDATDTSPGSGNGFVTSAPAGQTLDATRACSEPNKIPWFNVTPVEVQQTCQSMGGHICTFTTEWRRACRVEPVAPDCTFGYNPNNAACRTPFTSTKFCNIAPAFDFDAGLTGDQDGLLPTGDLTGENCFADWTGLIGNPASDDSIYDITGNLREIVQDGATLRVVGGAFNTQAESGATCDFSFYSVPNTFKFYDTGFRCCFDADPDP